MLRRLKRLIWLRSSLGFEETLWTRKVADTETRKLVAALNYQQFSALEISGGAWRDFSFRSYQSAGLPTFDICETELPERFDIIIIEHVLEHLAEPRKALCNVRRMLDPQGYLLTVTPFIYKVHPCPNDCTRWTEQGLKVLLADSGFDNIITGSWGNRKCIKATFKKEYRLFNRYLHSLENEPDYPIVVWGLAQKS